MPESTIVEYNITDAAIAQMKDLYMALEVTGLLVEVDPAGVIDHEAYLPVRDEEVE